MQNKFIIEDVKPQTPQKRKVTLYEHSDGVDLRVDGSVILILNNNGTLYRYCLNNKDKEFIQVDVSGKIKDC